MNKFERLLEKLQEEEPSFITKMLSKKRKR